MVTGPGPLSWLQSRACSELLHIPFDAPASAWKGGPWDKRPLSFGTNHDADLNISATSKVRIDSSLAHRQGLCIPASQGPLWEQLGLLVSLQESWALAVMTVWWLTLTVQRGPEQSPDLSRHVPYPMVVTLSPHPTPECGIKFICHLRSPLGKEAPAGLRLGWVVCLFVCLAV